MRKPFPFANSWAFKCKTKNVSLFVLARFKFKWIKTANKRSILVIDASIVFEEYAFAFCGFFHLKNVWFFASDWFCKMLNRQTCLKRDTLRFRFKQKDVPCFLCRVSTAQAATITFETYICWMNEIQMLSTTSDCVWFD